MTWADGILSVSILDHGQGDIRADIQHGKSEAVCGDTV